MGSIALRSTGRPAEMLDDRADGSVAVGERFVAAVAALDYKAIFGALISDVRFRYLIPPGTGEAVGAADVAAKYFDWFGDVDVLDVESILVRPIADRLSVRYRFVLRKAERREVVEQQTFMDVDERGRIAALDLLCSGFRPADEEKEGRMSATHMFDAGTLSCADGLAQKFRQQLLAIPLGDVLEVQTIDPATKEDIPALARMMGHTVLSVEPSEDGRLVISVERGR